MCPVHESHGSLTLAVSQGRCGAAMHCFAACETADILGALGLAWEDMFDEPRDRAVFVPRPRRAPEFTEGERRFLRGLTISRLREDMEFALFVAGEQPETAWQERVQLAERDCREREDRQWDAFMARCAVLAGDEKYVRAAYQCQDETPLRLSPEQNHVLALRAEDLERAR